MTPILLYQRELSKYQSILTYHFYLLKEKARLLTLTSGLTMHPDGFEPPTPCLSSKYSPAELRVHI